MALTVEEATARAERDMHASRIIDQLRISAGESFAGGWIDEGKAYIGITDQSLADTVTAAGASPVVMVNSMSKLERDKDAIDKVLIHITTSTASDTPCGIASCYIDVTANKIVVEALPESREIAQKLTSQAGVSTQHVDVRIVDKMPTIVSRSSRSI